MLDHPWIALLYRLLCAALLCAFAYVLLTIVFHSLRVVIDEPAKFDLAFVLVFAGAASLAYVLLLLAYRAATGKGRKADDGLLPPFVMKGLFVLFGVIAVLIIAMGLWQGEVKPVVGGLIYLVAAYGAWFRNQSVE